jgi:hypothetical protein
MKYSAASRAAWIEDHSAGLADRLSSSLKTRKAWRRYQGLAKRCRARWSVGANRPSIAWL